jgi:beta-xylosidase
VTTQTGENWFLHFQDKGAYGRVVHLQPMKWKDNWPVIGIDPDGDGKGEPVSSCKKPNVGRTYPIATPAESDEFNGSKLGLQWQWMANTRPEWMFANMANGSLRLYSAKIPADSSNLWNTPNVLLQKFPAEEFTATTKLTFTPNTRLDERAGLTIMGMSYACLTLHSGREGISLVYGLCKDAEKGRQEIDRVITKLDTKTIFLRVKVSQGAVCEFFYSIDGVNFTGAGEKFVAQPGRWIGAKMGIFCTRNSTTNDSGYADFDWFRVTPNE